MTQAYPLQWPAGWPRSKYRHDAGAKFGRADFYLSIARLEKELEMLGAKNCVLSTNLQTRMSGKLSSDDYINDPGVAVYFMLRNQKMSMARDAYTKVRDNVRSLALAIEHLRGLERHGGASMMERAFAGFTALPPPSGQAEEIINWRDELEMRGFVDLPTADQLDVAENRYRMKAKSVHSDQGGDDAKMILLNASIAQARAELKP